MYFFLFFRILNRKRFGSGASKKLGAWVSEYATSAMEAAKETKFDTKVAWG